MKSSISKSIDTARTVLANAIRAGLNVLLEGPYGVGKSSLVLSIAEQLRLQVKYFSTATLDPFVDLVGVPVPVIEEQKRRLVFLRPDAIDQAEVLFFDELNRAHPKVLNAVFEIVQFHSINGEKLSNLRCVLAAINPVSAGYHVEELDPALLDRFPIHLPLDFGPDYDWFVARFGGTLGEALVRWHQNDLDDQQRKAISNRRLDYLGQAIQAGIPAKHALSPGLAAPVHLLLDRLQAKDSVLTIEQFVADPDRFAVLVVSTLNIAIRFAQLFPMMSPSQMHQTREIFLALPTEALARLKSQSPFVFKKIRDVVARRSAPEEARAFAELLEERLEALAV